MTSNAAFEKFRTSGIIDAQDLHKLMGSKHAVRVKVLDATFTLPSSPQTPQELYEGKHIAGALFFDFKTTADTDSKLPNMLPNSPDFERIANGLGLYNDDFIVVYGHNNMVMGPARAWWMFRIFGHDNIAVLNGGLPAWEAQNLPIEKGAQGDISHRGEFSARFNDTMVVSKNYMLEHHNDAGHVVLDARPSARFSGETPEPRDNMRSGHIPNSINIPAKCLIDKDTGLFAPENSPSADTLKDAATSDARIIATCGSGVTACVLALALHGARKTNVAVYDGSWSEWGHEDANTPVAP